VAAGAARCRERVPSPQIAAGSVREGGRDCGWAAMVNRRLHGSTLSELRCSHLLEKRRPCSSRAETKPASAASSRLCLRRRHRRQFSREAQPLIGEAAAVLAVLAVVVPLLQPWRIASDLL